MLTINPQQVITGWCLYTLTDEVNEVIFIRSAKMSTVFTLKEAIANPDFESNKNYIFSILGIYNSRRDAQNAVSAWMQKNPFPKLNRTVRSCHYTMVKCHQTGTHFRNASEAAHVFGLNPGQLSLHLNRTPGHISVKGLTFERVKDFRTALQSMHIKHPDQIPFAYIPGAPKAPPPPSPITPILPTLPTPIVSPSPVINNLPTSSFNED